MHGYHAMASSQSHLMQCCANENAKAWSINDQKLHQAPSSCSVHQPHMVAEIVRMTARVFRISDLTYNEMALIMGTHVARGTFSSGVQGCRKCRTHKLLQHINLLILLTSLTTHVLLSWVPALTLTLLLPRIPPLLHHLLLLHRI